MRRQNILTAALACGLAFTTTGTHAQDASSAEAQAIAQDAYIYFYPLVMNTFSHARTFPPATFRGATHANFDTLYSVGWLDLTKEPVHGELLNWAKISRFFGF